MSEYIPPAVFDRENRCTKIHIHNAFFDGKGYTDTPRVQAQAVIGENAPKHMIDKGYIVPRLVKNVDMYCLTKEGVKWLHAGILRHLALHPSDIKHCKHIPPGYVKTGTKNAGKAPITAEQPSPAKNHALKRKTK